MKYQEFQPIPELKEYIQVIWMLESEDKEESFPMEQILPDGIVEVVFHFSDPCYTRQNGKRFRQPESFAISMMRNCVEIESAGTRT